MSCFNLLAVRVLAQRLGFDMAVLPDPDAGGSGQISDVAFYANVGSAVYFEMDTNPNVKIGDSFYFKSTGVYQSYDGEYLVTGTALVGTSVYQVTTSCIGTESVIGS
jgi:hypothetical protein